MSAPAERRVIEAAAALGITIEPRDFPEGTRTAAEAARAIGCDVAQIVKSLVFVADGEPVVALVSGRHRLDAGKLAVLAGASGARRATADEAREATGFAIGGTPPLGYPTPLRLWLDETLLDHEVVWAAAGTPSSVFPIAPKALIRVAGATPADLHGSRDQGE